MVEDAIILELGKVPLKSKMVEWLTAAEQEITKN
jgi:hypothetical protein